MEILQKNLMTRENIMIETVSNELTNFMYKWKEKGVPKEVTHEAKRLFLNQLKASVGATKTEAIKILNEQTKENENLEKTSQIIWLGRQADLESAAIVNGALFEVLDFHDTYIPCYMHATSAVLPALMAVAEEREYSGLDFLESLALGMEVELAIASILMPTAYYRGYVPAGLTGSVGAAAACSILTNIGPEKTQNAISIAMCTSFGLYVSVGSMTLPYITGATARSGLNAFQLAEKGFDGPATAFEGEKGMLVTHSDENKDKINKVLSSIGDKWKIFGQTYKTVPTETITHGPIELILKVLDRSGGKEIKKIDFFVCPIVKEICDERMERFGLPSSELTARFDLCFCAAAAWVRGKFTLEEMKEEAYKDDKILDLRNKINLIPDQSRKTFEGCSIKVEYLDGSKDSDNVDYFLGSPQNQMTDNQLSNLFLQSSKGFINEKKVNIILQDLWGLEEEQNIKKFISQLKLN